MRGHPAAAPRRADDVRRRLKRAGSLGQATAEFALASIIFFVLMFAIVDLGRVIWSMTITNSAAREAARYAIVHGGSRSNTCPVGPAGPDTTKTPAGSCLYPSPSKQYIYDAAVAAAIGAGSNVSVTACYGTTCSGNTDVGTNIRGTPVNVTVTSQVQLFTPALLGRSSFTITGTSTMVVNH
jgi:Flp pilus assembly protein TadG